MVRRIVEYLKLHEEFPKLTKIILEEDVQSRKDIAIRIAKLSPAKWGAIFKRIKIAYNIVKNIKYNISKMEKMHIKMFETKVLKKIYDLGKLLKNKTVVIREIIMEGYAQRRLKEGIEESISKELINMMDMKLVFGNQKINN